MSKGASARAQAFNVQGMRRNGRRVHLGKEGVRLHKMLSYTIFPLANCPSAGISS